MTKTVLLGLAEFFAVISKLLVFSVSDVVKNKEAIMQGLGVAIDGISDNFKG